MFEQVWKHLTNSTVNAVKVVTQKEYAVLDGHSFTHHEYHSVANGANLDHLFVVPTDKTVIMQLWQIKAADGPVYISVYEDTVVSALGTQETPGNNNRNSNISPSTTLYRAPTVTSVGNQMLNDFIGVTGSGSHVAVGSPTNSETDWLLKSGAKYLLRATNNSGGTTNILTSFTWIEV